MIYKPFQLRKTPKNPFSTSITDQLRSNLSP